MLDEIYNPKPKPSTSNTLKTERNYRGSSIPALDLEGESSGIIGPEIDGIRKIKYRQQNMKNNEILTEYTEIYRNQSQEQKREIDFEVDPPIYSKYAKRNMNNKNVKESLNIDHIMQQSMNAGAATSRNGKVWVAKEYKMISGTFNGAPEKYTRNSFKNQDHLVMTELQPQLDSARQKFNLMNRTQNISNFSGPDKQSEMKIQINQTSQMSLLLGKYNDENEISLIDRTQLWDQLNKIEKKGRNCYKIPPIKGQNIYKTTNEVNINMSQVRDSLLGESIDQAYDFQKKYGLIAQSTKQETSISKINQSMISLTTEKLSQNQLDKLLYGVNVPQMRQRQSLTKRIPVGLSNKSMDKFSAQDSILQQDERQSYVYQTMSKAHNFKSMMTKPYNSLYQSNKILTRGGEKSMIHSVQSNKNMNSQYKLQMQTNFNKYLKPKPVQKRIQKSIDSEQLKAEKSKELSFKPSDDSCQLPKGKLKIYDKLINNEMETQVTELLEMVIQKNLQESTTLESQQLSDEDEQGSKASKRNPINKKEVAVEEHAKFLRRVNMSIQEQINNMDCFKENLLLKFQRNQELIENDQAVWEDYITKNVGEKISEYGLAITGLSQESNIIIDRMRRLAGRGEQPYKKWKKILQTKIVDEENRRLYEVQENLMFEQIEKLKRQQEQDVNTVTDILRTMMKKISVSEMVQQGRNLLFEDQECIKQFYLNSQIIQLSHIFMASFVNSTFELQEIKEIRIKKKLEDDIKLERRKLEKEFMDMRIDQKNMFLQYVEQIKSLVKRNENLHKEKNRLEEIVYDLNGDIKILLSGSDNVTDVRKLVNDLSKSLNKMEMSQDKNTESSQTIKGFFQFFEKFQQQENYQAYLKQNQRAGRRKKKAQLGELEFQQMEYDKDGYEIRLIGGNANYKKNTKKTTNHGETENKNKQGKKGIVAGEVDEVQDNELTDTIDESKSNKDSDRGNKKDQSQQMTAKASANDVSRKQTPNALITPGLKQSDFSTRHEFLIAKGKEYMKHAELELYRKHRDKIIKKQMTNAVGQRYVDSSESDIDGWKNDDSFETNEKGEKVQKPRKKNRKMNLLTNQKIIEETNKVANNGSQKDTRSVITQTKMHLIKEPYFSLANQLELGAPTRKLMIPVLKRNDTISEYTQGSPLIMQKVKKLNDATVFKLLEQVQDVMIHVDAHTFNLSTEMLSYRDYLQKQLMTKYGLEQMAIGYMDQIVKRLKELSVEGQNTDAIFVLNLLGENTMESSNLQWNQIYQRIAMFAKKVFQEAQRGQLVVGGNSPAKLVKSQSRLDKSFSGDYDRSFTEILFSGQEVSIFDLFHVMTKCKPINQITLTLMDNLLPEGFKGLDQQQLIPEFMKFAQMKVVSKISKDYKFDKQKFLETLNVNENDQVELADLFGYLAEKHSIFFSGQQQIAIRNAFFPKHKDENIKDCQNLKVQLGITQKNEKSLSPQRSNTKQERDGVRTFLQLLTATKEDYEDHLHIYMIKKHDFIQYVLTSYKECLKNLEDNVRIHFDEYDKFHNRKCLNFEQFSNMIEQNLRMQLPNCFSLTNKKINSIKVFNNAVAQSEFQHDSKENLLNLEGVIHLITKQNYEVVPFLKYIRANHTGKRNISPQKINIIAKNFISKFKTVGTGASQTSNRISSTLSPERKEPMEIEERQNSDRSKITLHNKNQVSNLSRSLTSKLANISGKDHQFIEWSIKLSPTKNSLEDHRETLKLKVEF